MARRCCRSCENKPTLDRGLDYNCHATTATLDSLTFVDVHTVHPSRTIMPILGVRGAFFDAVEQQLSRLLHHLVYSFPTPDHFTNVTDSAGDVAKTLPVLLGLDETVVAQPGEPKAFAGGVGPLSFVGSGYGVTLILMGILLNRIHDIVRRPNTPPPPLPHPPITSLYHRAKLSIQSLLTSPSTPRYLRLPGLIFLARAWILFTILTLQVAKCWPVDTPFLLTSYTGQLIGGIGRWAGSMQMEKACWQVFLSVCAGLVCSGLANGLDRQRRRDVAASFNLFGYSFLLHLYSSPLTHHRPPPAAQHGRPDIHALFQLWLSLTELTWLQTVELSTELRRNQLLPTAVCGTFGLMHFVYALLTSPLRFPSFTFLTHLVSAAPDLIVPH